MAVDLAARADAVGGRHEPLGANGNNTIQTHQTRDTLLTAGDPGFFELGVNAWTAIGFSVLFIGRLNLFGQPIILELARPLLALRSRRLSLHA